MSERVFTEQEMRRAYHQGFHDALRALHDGLREGESLLVDHPVPGTRTAVAGFQVLIENALNDAREKLDGAGGELSQ